MPGSPTILPSPQQRWELWNLARTTSWIRDMDDPASDGKPPTIGLPARLCRTFSFPAPTEDKSLIRKLAFAQLEKRGLAQHGTEPAPFTAQLIRPEHGTPLVCVDVLLPGAPALLSAAKADATAPAFRFLPLPKNHLVVSEEQGRLVLCASSGGELVHSQILGSSQSPAAESASSIHLASLALQQQQIIPTPTDLTLWGDFPPEDAAVFASATGLPVHTAPRPAPDPRLVRRAAGQQLLPASHADARRRRRSRLVAWAAAAAALALPATWLHGQYKEVTSLEATAARMESTLDVPSEKTETDAALRAAHDLVDKTQQRWSALRSTLESKRYPAAHLDALTRCLNAADVVMTRFETKLSEVSVAGTARSARDAYNYYNAVTADAPLGVFSWSMAQPSLENDGSARFEIKGKLK
jgi:hypothetical protein